MPWMVSETAKRDPARTRAALLQAATRDFARNGFSGARTERIAAAAKCNIRLLYHHFGSKEGLYRAAIEAAYADLRHREAELAFDLADPLGCIDRLLRFTFAYFENNPDFEGLLRAENQLQGRFIRQSPQIQGEGAGLRARLEAVLAAGAAQGVIRAGVDPLQLYVTIAALSRFHLANAWSLAIGLDQDFTSPAWRAERLDHCAAMLRGWLTPSGGGA
ncbi:TetR/AcrR family transcriptional regulator [Sphingomonas sp. MMS12-HWE2-04]|uniref:TetR/AcrR family transcriptional regulator n=1 Tax=Sphingomonas sp. MMS12-HWE2-04 TaxID=3234199 RepID=UPI0038509EE5